MKIGLGQPGRKTFAWSMVFVFVGVAVTGINLLFFKINPITTLYISILVITIALTGALAYFAWEHRGQGTAMALLLITLNGCLLTIVELLSIISGSQAQAAFWFNLRFLFIAPMPVLWLVFAIQVSGYRQRISKKLQWGALAIPILTQVIIWTNYLHHWWLKQDVSFVQIGPFWQSDLSTRIAGPWFLVHAAYGLVLLPMGVYILAVTLWPKGGVYRAQTVLLVGIVVLQGIAAQIPVLFPKTVINPLIPAVGISTILFWIAIRSFELIPTEISQDNNDIQQEKTGAHSLRLLLLFVVIYVLMATGLIATGMIYDQNYEAQYLREVDSQLGGMGLVKVKALMDWRRERMGDAAVVYKNPAFTTLAKRAMADPADSQARSELQAWLDTMQSQYGYKRLTLFDSQLHVRFSAPGTPDPNPDDDLIKDASDAMSARQIIFMDFHRNSSGGPIQIELLVPIMAINAQALPVGALVMSIDPQVSIYPLVSEWPSASKSAESLLVRKEGAGYLLLNNTKFQPDAALQATTSLKSSADNAELAGMGDTTSFIGLDYRGVPAMEQALDIPGSPWKLVMKIDSAEVFSPLRGRDWEIIILAGSLMLIAGTLLGQIWRQQRLRFHRAQEAADQSLRKSEEKYRGLVEHASDGIFILDTLGRYLDANPVGCAMLGYSLDELRGLLFYKLIPEPDIALLKKQKARLLQGETVLTERCITRKDGSHLSVEANERMLPDGTFQSIQRDISERNHAAQALRDSEKRFSTIFHSSPVRVAISRFSDGVFLDVNEAFLESTGYARDEIIGHTSAELDDWLDPQEILRLRESLTQNRLVRNFEARLRHKSGMLRNVLLSADLVEIGGEECILSVGTDISDRILAEEKLRKAQEFLQAVQNSLSAHIAILDESGMIVHVNDAWRRFGEENGLPPGAGGIGTNYLAVCDAATVEYAREASQVAQAIRDVRAGARAEAVVEYPCHSPDENRWFTMRVTKFEDIDHVWLVVAHENNTQRVLAEAAVRESEERYRQLVEQSPDGIVVHRDGLIIFANSTAASMFGTSDPQELVGKAYLDLVHPENRVKTQERINRLLRGESGLYPAEGRYMKLGGSEIPVELGATIISYRGQQAVQVVARDISERLRAREAVRESEARYRQLVEQSPDGIVIYQDGRIVFTNSTAAKMIGAAHPEELIGKPIVDFVHPDSRAEAVKRAQSMLRGEYVTYPVEDCYLRLDGTEFPVEVVASNVTYLARPAIQVVVRDISERKRTSAMLLQSEERFRSVITKVSNIAVQGYTSDGTVRFWNKASEEVYGYSEAEALGKNLVDLIVPAEMREAVQADILKMISAGEGRAAEELLLMRKDGSRVPVLSSHTVVDIQGQGKELFCIDIDLSERKKMEGTLLEAEARFRSFIEQSADGVALIDIDGSIIEWNKAQAAITGIPRQEAMKTPFWEIQYQILPPERRAKLDPEYFKKPFFTAFQSGMGQQLGKPLDITIVSRSGERKSIQQTSFIIHTEKGNRVGAIVRDVTERIQAEENLRKNEQNYRGAITAAGLVPYVIDYSAQQFTFMGEDILKLTGYDGLEITPALLRSLIIENHPLETSGPEALPGSSEQNFRSGKLEKWGSDMLIRTRGGEERWLNDVSVPLLDASGQVTRAIGVIQDLSLRKRAEADLKKRASQLELINSVGREIAAELSMEKVLEIAATHIHSAFGFYHVAVFTLDNAHGWLEMKTRAGKMAHVFPAHHHLDLGQGLVGWAGLNGMRICVNDVHYDTRYKNAYPELIATQSELSIPLMAGNQVLGVLDIQSPEKDAFSTDDISVLEALSGQVAVAIENARLYDEAQMELAERKKAETALLEHRAHLEELIEMRTRDLYIAKEQAEQANRAKGDFLAMMSHEIRTPLNGVLGLATLMMKTALTEKQRDYMTNLEFSGETLLGTINDILDYSKIDSGQMTLETLNFDLDDVLQRVSIATAIRAHDKGLELIYDTEPDVPAWLVGDPNRLGQVLINLVGNAVKFTETGAIVAHIRVLGQSAAEATLEFAISDSGIGMTEAQLQRLFQPFTQADNSISRKYGGTGLGLTICKRLVNQMGGEINVKSQYGQGSTFSFHARFGRPETPVNIPEIPGELYGLRVCLFDESEKTLGALEHILAGLPFRVSSLSSPREALLHITREPADLVIADCELALGWKSLLESEKSGKTPRLLLLARSDELARKAQNVLDGVCIVKPVTRKTLLDGILRASQASTNTPSAGSSANQQELENLPGGRILLVEDNPINQMVGCELLRLMGCEVSVANDGQEAIEHIQMDTFDLVLMDIHMPGLDGYQVTALLRGEYHLGPDQLPIIAMTANALEGDRERSLQAGLNDHLVKPIDIPQLTGVLKRWLPLRVKPQSAPTPALEPVAAHERAEAIRRLDGNEKLYIRVMDLFHQNHANDMEKIRLALQNGDDALALNMTHNLKGVASTIGAGMLTEACRKVEAALKTGELDGLEAELDNMQALLDDLLSWIGASQQGQK